MKKKILLSLWGVVFVLALGYYLKAGIPAAQYPEIIRNFIKSLGFWGPLAYILIYTVRPIVFFPATVLTAVSGLIFGAWYGILYTMIGENLSANFAFIISRYFAREIISEKEKGWFKKLDQKIKESGFFTVLFMRLVYLPFDLVNYGCGLTSVSHKEYAWATLIGTLPGLITFVLLGSSFVDPRNLLISGAVFVLGLLLSRYLKKRHNHIN